MSASSAMTVHAAAEALATRRRKCAALASACKPSSSARPPSTPWIASGWLRATDPNRVVTIPVSLATFGSARPAHESDSRTTAVAHLHEVGHSVGVEAGKQTHPPLQPYRGR